MNTEQIAEERPWLPRTEQAEPDRASVRATLTGLERQVARLVRQRPAMAVLAAAGVGYVIARVVARAAR